MPHALCARLFGAIVALLCLAPAASAQVRISQVYGGGGNAFAPLLADYIEIYNAGAPQSLSGWSVQYAAATSGTWTVTALPNITLGTGQYLLVKEAVGTTLVAGTVPDLPTPDATGSISMATNDFKVALMKSTTALSGTTPTFAANVNLVDLVGLGATTTWNESAANGGAFSSTNNAPALSVSTSLYRRGCGGDDTNVSKDDWTTGLPSPRNIGNALNAGLTAIGSALPLTVEEGQSVHLIVTPSQCTTAVAPTGTVVTVDLTPIGGGAAVAMVDDGTSGDELAGDGTYTGVATVAAGVATGTKTLRVALAQGVKSGGTSIEIQVVPTSTPNNDNCSAAQVIAAPSTTAFSLTGALPESNALVTFNDPTTGMSSRRGLWYSVVGTGHTMTLSTCSSSTVDTVMAVFVGSCGGLATVAVNDDNGPGCSVSAGAASLSFCSQLGVTYLVWLGPFDTGPLTLASSLAVTDGGTTCTGAWDPGSCTGVSGPYTESEASFGPQNNDGCNTNAQRFTDIPTPGLVPSVIRGDARGFGQNRDVDVYRFQATTSTTINITLDTLMSTGQANLSRLSAGGVCPGTSLASTNIAFVPCNTGTQVLSSTVTAGEWYAIQVVGGVGMNQTPATSNFGGILPGARNHQYTLKVRIGTCTSEAECGDNDLCTNDICTAGACSHTALVIDDNSVCTVDACTAAGGPTHTPIAVDDKNACTTDACDAVTGPSHTPVSVDDNNVCTSDACDPVTGTTHVVIPFDDSNACTNDSCDPLTGPSHAPVDTDDLDLCTSDGCDPLSGPTHTPVDTDDHNLCTSDACDPFIGPTYVDGGVDDNNACTADTCDPDDGISHTPIALDDFNACTSDTCDPVLGAQHTPVDLDDHNACTSDTCDPVSGVKHTAVSADDGNVCTADSCDPVLGVAHTPVSLDDGNVCTADSCEPLSGVKHTPVSVDDGNACTSDTCDPVNGITHSPVSVDDGNVCTTDSCNPATGVAHVAISVDDGNVCTTDSCNPTTGVAHVPVSVDDSNVCTTDSCDPVNGVQHVAIALDDGSLCTNDSCDPVGGVRHTPVQIDDNNACTADSCHPVTGIAHTSVSVDDGNACTTDSCAPATGVAHVPVSVDDGNACTTDSCAPATGVAHVPVSVDDGNVCTTDSCAPATGVAHVPVSVDDGNVCTTDACDPATGVTHVARVCDDGDACTTDGCNVATGCTTTPVSCADQSTCTIDSCDPASGCEHTTIDCDDDDPCTGDSCVAATGCAHAAIVCAENPCSARTDGTPCDGGPCATAAACDDGACVATTATDCDDDDPCTTDTCDAEVGCVSTPLDDGDPCDDHDLCTTGTTCSDGLCDGGENALCDAPDDCEKPGVCNPSTGLCDFEVIPNCGGCASDDVAPTIVCPAAPSAAECVLAGAPVALGQASASDACSAVTVSDDRPASYPKGVTTVTFTASDAAGNHATCTVDVTVLDRVAPVIACPADDTTASGCAADVTIDTSASDVCDGTVAVAGAAETRYAAGRTPVTLTARDAAGNEATCETAVVVTAPDDLAIGCEPTVTLTAPDDACGWSDPIAADVVGACGPLTEVDGEPSPLPLGTTTVTFSTSDSGRNATCQSVVTVVDGTKPTIDCGAPDAKVALPATFTPTASDACGATITIGDVGCARLLAGEQQAVSERCEVAVEGTRVVASDAPPAKDGFMLVTYQVTARDPSGNETTFACTAPVDPSSIHPEDDDEPKASGGSDGGCSGGASGLGLMALFGLLVGLVRSRRV